MHGHRRLPLGLLTGCAIVFFAVSAAPGAGIATASDAVAVDFPEAVARALRNNAAVSAAGYAWTSAKSGAKAARGNYLPKLSFEERFARTNVPAEAFALKLNEERLTAADFADVNRFNQAAPINDYITSFTLEQPVFAPRAYLGYEMASREAKAAGLDLTRSREETVFRVVTAYLDVRTAKKYVRVAQEEVGAAREHLRTAEAKQRSGTGLLSDVLRARVFLASAESTRVTADSRLALAQTALGLAMGERGGTRVDASAPPPPLPEAGTLAERIAAVRAGRSDLRALSLRVANAGTNVTLRKSDYLPTVGVTGAYRIDAHDGILSPDNRTWSVGVGLTWNLFDGLRREAEVAKAAAERKKTRELYRGAEDRAAFEVTEAHLGVEEAGRRVEIARAAVAAAEEGTRLVALRYGNDLARMIDLLDAQAALNGARAGLVRAENDLRHARARLEYASGTLLHWAWSGSGGKEDHKEGRHGR